MIEVFNQEAFDKAMEAFRHLIEQVQELEEFYENLVKETYSIPRYEPFPKPPRRMAAKGLAPPQRPWWVNYKARDKLRPMGRKLAANGGNRHAEKQKAGISGSRRHH